MSFISKVRLSGGGGGDLQLEYEKIRGNSERNWSVTDIALSVEERDVTEAAHSESAQQYHVVVVRVFTSTTTVAMQRLSQVIHQ